MSQKISKAIDNNTFKRLLEAFSDLGGELNSTKIRFIKASIEKNGYSNQQIQQGMLTCFEKEQFFNWANVIKHIPKQEYKKLKG